MESLPRSRSLAMTLERLQFADFRAKVRAVLNEAGAKPVLTEWASDAEVLAALERVITKWKAEVRSQKAEVRS